MLDRSGEARQPNIVPVNDATLPSLAIKKIN